MLADEKASAKEKRRFPLMSTYELALKCSNLFNLLDARGAISVTERVGMIGRIRNLAVGVAKAYAAQQVVAASYLAFSSSSRVACTWLSNGRRSERTS